MPLRLGRFELRRRALKSRVARRILLLFFACALLPIGAFALFSFQSVSAQLESDARTQLRASNKAAGMALLERLHLLDATLVTIARETGAQAPGPLTHPLLGGRFLSVALVDEVPLESVREAAGSGGMDPEVERHLAEGHAMLSTTLDGDEATARIILTRTASEGRLLVAEIDPAYLWQEEVLSEDVALAVYDGAGRLLFGYGSDPPPPSPGAGRHSGLRWSRGDEEQLGEAWELFMRSLYAADSWSLVQYVPERDIMAPMRSFQTIFVMVSGLALALVTILSIAQIRRQLVPIDTLHDATEQIASGNWATRVDIRTKDEFRDLGDSFNAMTEAIQDLRENLEDKVQARTRELAATLEELRSTQAQLVHREKMASVGTFVAGIAHEINNPVSFIEGNLDFVRGYSETLGKAIERYQSLMERAGPGLRERMEGIRKELDLDFVLEDLASVLDGCAEGAERTTTLVGDLRTFSRVDSAECTPLDLHEALEATLNLLRSRLCGLEIVKDFGDLPEVECLASQINQVLLNLVANAADASDRDGRITIRTFATTDGQAVVEVEDEGCGMDEATAAKVFDPFFTTKPVGDGTGLGLSISYGVVSRHSGSLTVRSVLGEGACFRLALPIRYVGEGASGSA